MNEEDLLPKRDRELLAMLRALRALFTFVIVVVIVLLIALAVKNSIHSSKDNAKHYTNCVLTHDDASDC